MTSSPHRFTDHVARDAGAGLSVALVSIPEGMAYAMVAGVSPIYGLYTGTITTIVAALTGSTSLLIVTLTNALAPERASPRFRSRIPPVPSSRSPSWSVRSWQYSARCAWEA